MPRVLLLFVDGVGLGDDAVTNPFTHARLPSLHRLLGVARCTRAAAPHHGASASLIGVDATLGFDGTPQSGTGQATLLTGLNAVSMHGRHFGPWVPARLRRMVREHNILTKALAGGYRVAFANAYPEEVLAFAADPVAEPVLVQPVSAGATPAGARRQRVPAFMRAAPPLAAMAAGLLTRHTPELERGDAVASEITNAGWRERLGRESLPEITGADAGRNLAAISARHDLTLFAHYATDHAGHSSDMDRAVDALELLDEFIGGIADALPPDVLLFLISDHGNIEDMQRGHTRNPAMGVVAGAGHTLIARRLRSLMDVTPTILDVLAM